MKDCGFSFTTTYLSLPKQFFTEHNTDNVVSPKVIIVNTSLAGTMGLDFSSLSGEEQANLFSGNHQDLINILGLLYKFHFLLKNLKMD